MGRAGEGLLTRVLESGRAHHPAAMSYFSIDVCLELIIPAPEQVGQPAVAYCQPRPSVPNKLRFVADFYWRARGGGGEGHGNCTQALGDPLSFPDLLVCLKF